MERMDLFTTVHKGLRATMFEATERVARTDFTEPSALEQAAAAVRRCLSLLEEHAHLEDLVVFPEIAQIGPALFADLNAEHTRVGGLQTEIAQLLDRLLAAPPAERLTLGRRLHERMGRLVAAHLQHMDGEETTATRLLWAHRTDDELRALHGRVLGSIPPDRMRIWAEVLLPAINPAERAILLAGLQAKLPAEAFERLSSAV
jgi:hypothetical protein